MTGQVAFSSGPVSCHNAARPMRREAALWFGLGQSSGPRIFQLPVIRSGSIFTVAAQEVLLPLKLVKGTGPQRGCW